MQDEYFFRIIYLKGTNLSPNQITEKTNGDLVGTLRFLQQYNRYLIWQWVFQWNYVRMWALVRDNRKVTVLLVIPQEQSMNGVCFSSAISLVCSW